MSATNKLGLSPSPPQAGQLIPHPFLKDLTSLLEAPSECQGEGRVAASVGEVEEEGQAYLSIFSSPSTVPVCELRLGSSGSAPV